jgi:phosphatidylglycerol:prolipoprotein diacylglycerol transferase
MLDLFRSGGVILGGIIAAAIVAVIYFRKYKLNAWKICDIAAPSIALGQAIGRIGCFLVGCCYGGTCSAGWAITFTDPVAHQHTGVPLHVGLHPVQLYNSFSNFTIFLLLTFLFTKRKFTGQIFLFYMLFYSVSRFTTEFFRGDISRISIGGPLSDAQYIAVAGFLIAVVLMGLRLRKLKRN